MAQYSEGTYLFDKIRHVKDDRIETKTIVKPVGIMPDFWNVAGRSSMPGPVRLFTAIAIDPNSPMPDAVTGLKLPRILWGGWKPEYPFFALPSSCRFDTRGVVSLLIRAGVVSISRLLVSWSLASARQRRGLFDLGNGRTFISFISTHPCSAESVGFVASQAYEKLLAAAEPASYIYPAVAKVSDPADARNH